MLDILINPPQERVYLDLESLPHNLVAVRISGSLNEFKKELGIGHLNEAHVMACAQQAWKIAESTAEQADYVLAAVKEDIPGDNDHYAVRVVGVYRPVSFGVFTPVGPDEKPRRSFLGEPAAPEVANLYLNRYLKDIVKTDPQPLRVLNKKKSN